MADWRDGAEYAPLERPDGFATPRADALETPPPRVDPAAGAPLQHPSGFQPSQQPTVPLEALVPATKEPSRDPRLAFESATTQTADTSAWGAAHASFNPRAPMAVEQWNEAAPLGAPGSTASFAPPTGAPVAPGWSPAPHGPQATGPFRPPNAPAPVPANESLLHKIRRLIGLVGWGYYLVVVLALIIRPLSILFLLAAIVFATRTKIAKTRLQQFTGIAVCVALFCGLVFNPNSDALDSLNTWSQVFSVVIAVVSMVIVSAADADSRRPGGPPGPPRQPGPPGSYGPPPGPRR